MDSFYDEDGKVICQVCKKSFHFITPRHLNLHNMTSNEYKEKYNAPVFRKISMLRDKREDEKLSLRRKNQLKRYNQLKLY